jgi:short-subunit dehydrogenase
VVINVASTSAFQPVPMMAVYAATKAFVLSFTEALWWESRGSGVRVLALCPGATETEFFDRSGAAFMTYGRQSAAQVVAAALAAVDGSSPTVVPGGMNKLRTVGHRLIPRRVMPRLAERTVR